MQFAEMLKIESRMLATNLHEGLTVSPRQRYQKRLFFYYANYCGGVRRFTSYI